MPCDVIIGKGALNFPCEVAERGHDGPHATPSILASVQARQLWERQQAARTSQPGPGLPYQNYEQFQEGTQKPHPRQMVPCMFCTVQVPYEEFYVHVGTHAGQQAQQPAQAAPVPQSVAWEPQGPPPGQPAPTATGVVGASSADALAQHIAQYHRAPAQPAQPVPSSPAAEQVAHMAEVMDYSGRQPSYSQPIPTQPYPAQPQYQPQPYQPQPNQPFPAMDYQGYPFPVANGQVAQPPNLWDEVQTVLNRHSRENMSNTPDFILAQYLASALEAYEHAVVSRDSWYSLSQPAGV